MVIHLATLSVWAKNQNFGLTFVFYQIFMVEIWQPVQVHLWESIGPVDSWAGGRRGTCSYLTILTMVQQWLGSCSCFDLTGTCFILLIYQIWDFKWKQHLWKGPSFRCFWSHYKRQYFLPLYYRTIRRPGPYLKYIYRVKKQGNLYAGGRWTTTPCILG